MSVESAEWRFVGRHTLVAAGQADMLDAIYTLGTSNTYYDGSSRTPGSGSAGTWSRSQPSGTTEAVYCTPAVSPIDHRIIVASRSSSPSPSPTMAAPDTFAVNVLVGSIVKNAGAFDSWHAASPFTSGESFGYWKIHNTALTSLTGTMNMWEFREGVAIEVLSSSANFYFIAGALWDPESPDTVSDAESDGKVYGMMCGNNQFVASGFDSTWLSASAGGLRHQTQASANHSGCFVPNSSTTLNASPIGLLYSSDSNNAASLYTTSGRVVRIPIIYRSRTTSATIGRLREIVLAPESRLPQRLMSGEVPVGYFFGPSDSTNVPCVMFEH